MKAKYLIATLILMALVVAVLWIKRDKPTEVTLVAVGYGPVEETVANTRAGTVKACLRTHLSPSIGGQIAVLNVHEGQKVKRGGLLLELWNQDLKAQVGLREKELKTAISQSESTCLNAEVARRESDRLHRLKGSGATSTDALDKANTEANVRATACTTSQLQVDVKKANIDVIKAKLEKTRLYAPFDGVIAALNGELNEYVTPSPPGIATTPVIDLINTDCFYITAPIDEVDVGYIRADLPARLTLDAFGNRQFPGKVRRVGAYVIDLEKQARTVDVEVEFNDPDTLSYVLAGYSADVEIILNVKNEALRIPSEAIIEGDKVYTFDPDSNRLRLTSIETGMANWDFTEVTSGLVEGDQVVTSVGKVGVEDGAAVVSQTTP